MLSKINFTWLFEFELEYLQLSNEYKQIRLTLFIFDCLIVLICTCVDYKWKYLKNLKFFVLGGDVGGNAHIILCVWGI